MRDEDYKTLEEATAKASQPNSITGKPGKYTDVAFTGVVRIFGTCDAHIDLYDEFALEGEDFDAFQVRMTLDEKLDIDLIGAKNSRPWYRPFDLKTYKTTSEGNQYPSVYIDEFDELEVRCER